MNKLFNTTAENKETHDVNSSVNIRRSRERSHDCASIVVLNSNLKDETYSKYRDPTNPSSGSFDGNSRATILGVISRIVVWHDRYYQDNFKKMSLTGCGHPDLPTFTARVDAVLPWINQLIAKADRNN